MHETAVCPAEETGATVMPRRGRRTLLTPELQQAICANIAAGLSQRDAAELAGVPSSTFYGWLQRGETERKRLEKSKRAKPKASEKPFMEFSEAVKKALLDYKKARITGIQQAAAEHWQANAWILERRFPNEFGQKILVRQQVVAELEDVLDRLERNLDPATFAQVIQIVADAGDGAAETADSD